MDTNQVTPPARFLTPPALRWAPRYAWSLLSIAVASCLAAHPLRAGQSPMEVRRPSLALSAGMSFLADPDMRNMYGTLPAGGLRLHVPTTANAQLFAGVQYSSKTTVAFDDPVFETDDDAELILVSVELGLRTNLTPGHLTRAMIGVAAEYLWMRERTREVDSENNSVWRRETGRGGGFRVLVGPEWELGQGAWIVGSELSAGPRFVNLDADDTGWTLEFTGLSGHFYVARRL